MIRPDRVRVKMLVGCLDVDGIPTDIGAGSVVEIPLDEWLSQSTHDLMRRHIYPAFVAAKHELDRPKESAN